MKGLLQLNGVSKTFAIYKNNLTRFAHWFGLPVKKDNIQILNEITFEVGTGESVAILGRNGAGKSTLLKIIAGTMKPSLGHVVCNGKVAAILELGLGFNNELSGEENARHVLAMQENTSDPKLLKSIVEFSELGKYFYMPLRTYSSGMLMRLAFSIATVRQPEILIVDEALSVGDASFQHKCIERIKEYRSQGTCLLFVSHDKNAILELCDRAILLNKGHVIKQGDAKEVLDVYNALLSNDDEIEISKTSEGYGNKKVEILQASLVDSSGAVVKEVSVGERVKLHVSFGVNDHLINDLSFGFKIRTKFGHEIFGTNTYFHNNLRINDLENTGNYLEVEFSVNLGPGVYVISGAVHKAADHTDENYHWVDDLLVFTVINKDKPYFIGTAYLPVSFTRDNV